MKKPAAQPDDPAARRIVGVIDIGSNSIRLMVARLGQGQRPAILDEARESTRLATGVGASIPPELIRRAAEVISAFARRARSAGSPDVYAIATAAVRDAANRDQFVTSVRARTGITPKVLSAAHEGRLAFLGAAAEYDMSKGPCAVVDIGGGSVQIVQSYHGMVRAIHSLPLGAVRVTDRYSGAKSSSGARFQKAQRFVDQTLTGTIARRFRTPVTPVICGTGGAFSSLAAVLKCTQDDSITRAELSGLLGRARGMSPAELSAMPGMAPGRADIFVAGLLVAERVMAFLDADRVQMYPGGIREGLLIELATPSEPVGTPMDEVRRFAAACRYPLAHSEHVSKLALLLHAQLPEPPADEERERFLLQAAAVLHDIGQMIEYKRHHRHSESLIRHSGIHAFAAQDLKLIATIARYHRKHSPSADNRAYSGFGSADQQTVHRLAGILRVADGLDREHRQNVVSVEAIVQGDEVQIVARSAESVEKNIAAAREKSEVLAAALGKRVAIRREELASTAVRRA